MDQTLFQTNSIAPYPFLDLLPEFGGRDPDLVVVVDKETHDPLGQVHVVSRVLFSVEHNLKKDVPTKFSCEAI